jgi:hypothetical protein
MHGSPPIEPHIVVCFGNSVKDEERDCGSKVIMSGVNSNVIMSGYGDENPNDESPGRPYRQNPVYFRHP